jgi:hypothetical protein
LNEDFQNVQVLRGQPRNVRLIAAAEAFWIARLTVDAMGNGLLDYWRQHHSRGHFLALP